MNSINWKIVVHLRAIIRAAFIQVGDTDGVVKVQKLREEPSNFRVHVWSRDG